MGLQSACCLPHSHASVIRLSPHQRPFYPHVSSTCYAPKETHLGLRKQRRQFKIEYRDRSWDPLLLSLKPVVIVCASNSNHDGNLNLSGRGIGGVLFNAVDSSESLRGKSGSASFYGLTHQLVEEGKLVSAPFKENTGSLLWIVAPVALISSLILPQLFFGTVFDGFFRDPILAETVALFYSEVIFYIGLAIFLLVTDQVQKPYLQFSSKRWSLITGFKGYLTSAFFTMGLKVVAPMIALYITLPILGLPALVSVGPLVSGFLAQFAFEKLLDKSGSSCWPLVPIIFELYRLYQLTKAVHFIEKILFAMKDLPTSLELLERNGALFALIVTFQVVGLVSLWSLLTFLQRLFPSRLVAENY